MRGLWRLEAGVLQALWQAARRLSPDRASDLGERIGRALGPRQPKHGHVLRNFEIAFPDRPRRWIEETAAAMWGQVGRTVAEYPHLRTICHGSGQRRIEVIDEGGLAAVRASGRSAIFASAHLANWNLSPVAADRHGIPLSVVYSAQHNAEVEGLIAPHRAEIGSGFILAEDAGRQMIAELRQGRSIGLLLDQRFDGGEDLPFFGVPTPTAIAPARLAVKLGIPFVPARVERLEGARFRITVGEPINADPTVKDPREAARRMTLALNRLFEDWIRAAPEQWLCAKRRWPKDAVPHRAAASVAPLAA